MANSNDSALIFRNPLDMLNISRLDVMVKKLLMDVAAGTRVLQKDLIIQLYCKHIIFRTAGREPLDAVYTDAWQAKNSFEDYLNMAVKLFESMQENGFDPAFPIPTGPVGTLYNGAHRLAAALSLNIPQVPTISAQDGKTWGYDWFSRYFSAFERLFILKEYALFKPNCAPVILWGACEPNWDAIEQDMRRNFSVTRVDTLDFEQNFDGLFYFIQELYQRPEFKDEIIRRKATLMGLASSRMRILHVEDKPGTPNTQDFFSRLKAEKTRIREAFSGMPPKEIFWTIHTPDDPAEKQHMVEMLYNRNRTRIYRFMSRPPMPAQYTGWVQECRDVCAQENIDTNDICLTGSGAYALLGVRPATDIDFTPNSQIRPRYGDGSKSLSPNIDVVSLSYHRTKKGEDFWIRDDELIYGPEYHFRYAGFKFSNPEIVYARKNFSRREKDVRDLGLMRQHLKRVRAGQSHLRLPELARVEANMRAALAAPAPTAANFETSHLVHKTPEISSMFRKNNPNEASYLPAVEVRLEHKPAGQVVKHIGSSFYRGENCNFNPYQADYARPDFLETFLLKGWMPQSRFLNADTKITAFGSCFARNFSNHLGTIGYSTSKDRAPDIYISTMGEGLVNVHALLQQFEWAFENVIPPDNLWHGYDTQAFGIDEEVRLKTREVFMGTDFFIITLSISEVWYDSQTGGVLWRAVPQDKFDPARHKFRVCSFEETKAALNRMYELIKKHVPNAKLLFTLSPISLAATFRPQSCVSANSASKAILRAALDEFYRDHGDALNTELFYFPSFEMVIDLFPSRFSEDMRHTYPEITQFTMKLFEAIYCQTDTTFEEVNALFKQTRKITNARL